MTLAEEKNGEVVILRPSDRIDTENSKVLLDRITGLIESGERYLLVDFAQVAYINSSGLRGLILATKRLYSSGGRLSLVGVSEQILRVFKVSGLTSVLSTYSTTAEALSSFPR